MKSVMMKPGVSMRILILHTWQYEKHDCFWSLPYFQMLWPNGWLSLRLRCWDGMWRRGIIKILNRN